MVGGVRIARRMGDIQPFHVMDILARAKEMEARGRSIVHMEVGEPDFDTPRPIVEAGKRALDEGHTRYAPSCGIRELREAISTFYRTRHGVDVPRDRIVITPGATGALQLVLGVLVEPGERVLMTDPGYPCNKSFVRMLEGRVEALPVGPETGYQLTPGMVEGAWTADTAAVLAASPANPTGTTVPRRDLARIAALARERGGWLVVDEIYHGLTYGSEAATVLADTTDVFVINSFSKYFGMTGWRVGWLVAPEPFLPAIDRLAQNVVLSVSAPAQRAALAAFEPATIAILEERRREFQARRDYLVPALREIGFGIPVLPQGAFYVYADSSRFSSDSFELAHRLLEQGGVAVTPGIDFGSAGAGSHVRFAYTTSLANLEEGVRRLGENLVG